MAAPLSDLVLRLALTDEEALEIFSLAPLDAISGAVEHRPEIAILDAMTAEAAVLLGDGALPRWLRSGRPGERPLDLLRSGDFGAFEDALAQRVATVT
jgi:hypothetical protein